MIIMINNLVLKVIVSVLVMVVLSMIKPHQDINVLPN
jgi:hypothetical protein